MSIANPPAYVYISSGLLTTMRRELSRFLLHRYTRTKRIPVPAGEDSWNLTTYTFGTPVKNLPCFYEERAETEIMPSGLVVLNRPRIIVPYNDGLLEGDIVTNIIALDNTIILAGPLIVDEIHPDDPNVGGPILFEGFLRQFEYEPSTIQTV